MKKISCLLLTIAAVLCLATVARAQYTHTFAGIGELTFPKENHEDYGNNQDVGFSKNISSPVNGKYWIKLEAYAKGAGIQTTTSTPSDVLLILDISTSMEATYNYTDKDGTSHTGSRLEALKRETQNFVTSLYANAASSLEADPTFAGNRVGIISFGGFANDDTGGWKDVYTDKESLIATIESLQMNNSKRGTWTSSGLRVAIDNYLDGDPNSKRSNANLTVVVFTDGEPAVGSGGNIDGVQIDNGGKEFSSYIANNAVYYAHTLKAEPYNAKVFTVTLLDSNPDQKTIPFAQLLSSNYPDANAAFQSTAEWTYSSTTGRVSATNLSYGNTEDTGYHQNVDPDTDLSSIFDEIASQSGSSTNTSLSESTSTIDIVSSSFELSGSHSASDIKIYTAPYLYNETAGLYFGDEVLAPCSGGEGPNVGDTYIKKAWTDDEGVEHPQEEKDVDDDIAIVESQLQNNIVEVEGFDYSNNWCGPITQGNKTVGAQGHKLIILIPIEMAEDAVGGPNVATNATGSGIWVNKDEDEEPLITFTSPTVSLPVNLSIKKENLKKGENAKFLIMRGVITEERPEDADETWHPDYSKITDWEYVTSIFVPNKNGSNEVKIKGLPSTSASGDYVYRIIEEDWSWTYTFDSAEGKGYIKDAEGNITIDDITIKNKFDVYSDKFVTNPIVFSNEEEADADYRVRHAESKATNTFLNGGAVKYSDSKDNGR